MTTQAPVSSFDITYQQQESRAAYASPLPCTATDWSCAYPPASSPPSSPSRNWGGRTSPKPATGQTR